jgi:NAD(P)-dependent dehydrogenase (short-subunit alcohol dehydrogenase family)
MNSESLRGRIAVLTGASSGIGAAVARALAREGVHVALAARREDALLEVQAGLDHRGGEVRSLIAATDVADRDQVKSLVARTEEELGPVDVLVNCTGIMYYTLVFFSNYTTPYSKVPCPTDRRRARGASRAGLGG